MTLSTNHLVSEKNKKLSEKLISKDILLINILRRTVLSRYAFNSECVPLCGEAHHWSIDIRYMLTSVLDNIVGVAPFEKNERPLNMTDERYTFGSTTHNICVSFYAELALLACSSASRSTLNIQVHPLLNFFY